MDSLIEGVVRRVIREELVGLLAEQPFRLALPLPEAAKACGYSLQSLRNAIDDNDLVPSYANAKPVIMVEELVRWLRTLPVEAP